jgi:drug/metabolite transporter (DMT)-like permease
MLSQFVGKAGKPKVKLLGMALVLIGASLWGISGTVVQFLFQHKGYNPEWLVVIRLLTSGILLLMYSKFKKNKDIFLIWKLKEDRIHILIFGFFGMLGVQYTYFAAIEAGNAATATVLQYLGPVFILGYIVLKSRRFPTHKETISIFLALLGTFLLVTNGNVQSLSISKWAVFWGISSAIALAFYTLQPVQLIKKWETIIVVGWGMLVGGIGFSFINPPWVFNGQWSLSSFIAILFIIIFGTVIPFYCYLESLNYINATEASLLACVEPLSAAFLSVIWLHVSFGLYEWIGTILILATIAILAQEKKDTLE